jgi:spermidine/putrescine transport system substrate-binding protein
MQRNLKGWLAVLLIVVLVIAACGPSPAAEPAADEPAEGATTEATPQADAPAAASERCGDASQLSDSISFYNWSDYIDPEILTMFEEECGVEVVYDTFSSNEDLLAKLQGGATGYDLIVPSDYMVTIMVQLGLLKELDHANIPNLAHIHERFLDAPFDPGNRYSVPYQWGTAGIGYDADQVTPPPTSLAAFFDPAQAEGYAGKLSLLNDSRETIGAALKYLGYSMNSTDPAQLEEAKQVILAIKPYVLTFDSDTYSDLLVSGETVIGHGWNGGFYQAIFENEDRNIAFVVPEEGLTLFTDNLAIPASAPNPYTAEVLINYLNDPEIAAMITNFTYYASPNQAALEFIVDEIKNDPGIYPPQEVLDNTEFIVDVGEATQLYERIWTEIKAQ